ncbi:seminal vesicle secretory protein 5-like [Arvicola amphibius]|uniref:seminal vesicle secretory protein 5-like n=1 Tax=Arvicola amphibius TaxID=1047088 RepID=UPI0018E2E2BE|nr:seminal vesicle secretory protein 5-like [Arvicola amphibius]
MNPTSFFLLTLLLVLVTEAAARGPRGKFSQAFEDRSSENLHVKVLGGSEGSSSSHEEYSRSKSSWSSFKSKSPKTDFSEEGHLDYKTRGSQGEEGMSSFKSRMKTRIADK